MTELNFHDFVWSARLRTLRAVRGSLSWPLGKPLGERLLVRDCWGVDKEFKLTKTRNRVLRYTEQGKDLERPLKLVVVE